MKKTGISELPLHYGKVPPWLFERMTKLGTLIIESLVINYGRKEVLRRLSDPFWFQAFGAVLGMDWHSSGITTSVMGALKAGLNPLSKELGIYICGGRGNYARQTPNELKLISDKIGLNGDNFIHCSRLTAKIDNVAIQDGYQLYLHNFIITKDGDWAVIQQGMNTEVKYARRYHWLSENVKKFDEEPHTGVVGNNLGKILNLTHKDAVPTKNSIINLSNEKPEKVINEYKYLLMSSKHEVIEKDVDLKRLGSVLATAYNKSVKDFCEFLLINGVGPRTIQSLVFVSEIIFGTPSRFEDPARFSFAHGGKDGHPFPVPLKVYDETINILENAVKKSKIGEYDKNNCLKKLNQIQLKIEKDFNPKANFNKVLEKERKESKLYGGKTVFDK